MKTSLNLDSQLVKKAKQEALRTGKTVSELISYWAHVGVTTLQKKRNADSAPFKPVRLGGAPKIDLTSRRDWLDTIDDL